MSGQVAHRLVHSRVGARPVHPWLVRRVWLANSREQAGSVGDCSRVTAKHVCNPVLHVFVISCYEVSCLSSPAMARMRPCLASKTLGGRWVAMEAR